MAVAGTGGDLAAKPSGERIRNSRSTTGKITAYQCRQRPASAVVRRPATTLRQWSFASMKKTLPRGDSCINHVPLCRDALAEATRFETKGTVIGRNPNLRVLDLHI